MLPTRRRSATRARTSRLVSLRMGVCPRTEAGRQSTVSTSPTAWTTRVADGVLQFADVPRPRVRLQRRERRGVHCADVLAEAAVRRAQKVVHEQRDVAAALAQRRQLDREAVEPVEQVLAELPGGRQRVEVLVGGGDRRARRS